MTTNDKIQASQTTSQNAELVPPSFACPKCGQRDINQITTEDDGETTTCQSCGTNYTITQIPTHANTATPVANNKPKATTKRAIERAGKPPARPRTRRSTPR